MLLAAIGDIRGNLPALQATLDMLHEEGIQTIVNTGDSVVGHPWGDAVIDALQASQVISVQGESDRRIVRFRRKRDALKTRLAPPEFEALQRAYEACTSRHLEYLRDLPHMRSFTIDGVSIALCHGTLSSQAEGLKFAHPLDRFLRQREIVPAQIIVCGRGQDAFTRTVEDALFVHPGSVGMADDGRAHYTVISTEEKPIRADHRTLAYSSAEDAG